MRPVGEAEPEKYDGQILVPFPIESSLSGVQRSVSEKEAVWYRRTFTVPADWKGERVLLHFGAVDYEAEVYVNGIKTGGHKGGFTGFMLDITPFLKKGVQEVAVRVWDLPIKVSSRGGNRPPRQEASGTRL